MSLEPRSDDGVPELTARVVRAAFPQGTLAVRIREALGPLFADEDFAAAFPRRGSPAVSPGSRSPTAARARCGPGAPRRHTASGDAA